MDNRPSWDEYFMEMCDLARSRSTCIRRGVGAVIVKDNRVIASGYNGAPKGVKHCSETGCLRQQLNVPSGQRHELCRAVHAEQNAIIQAANLGLAIEGATIYCTTQPCAICAKMIINAGIVRVVCAEVYPDEIGDAMLKEAGVKVEVLPYKK
ncbi:MAG: cytidine/deoxycytidylate deaminase family protein [Bacillota bacterium]|nr:cytidine/deoxycytidylate deaminase family protein [Bacillota bacterium]